MNNLKYKLRSFFYGRYGIDSLNKCIITLAVIVSLISLFYRSIVITIICYVLLGIYLFRSLSKNFVARQRENFWYLDHTKKIRRSFMVIGKNHKDKANHYYLCPKCGQMVRIPRGRGKVEIHCPKCGNDFKRKS